MRDAFPQNPFTPSFGEVPAILAGRASAVRPVERALELPNRDPSLTTYYTGARGSGKTVLLSLLARHASEHGWVAANVTALPGMLEDLLEQALDASAHIVDLSPRPHLSGVGMAGVSLSWHNAAEARGNWRSRMTALLRALHGHGTGLLITVDEVRPDLDEMVQLAATYQHFVREGHRVALLMAGLPYNLSRLLSDKSVSFLRRAQGHHLGHIDDADVRAALRATFEGAGRAIPDDLLARVTDAVDGFPYLMQLAGYHVWGAEPLAESVSGRAVEQGLATARDQMREHVLVSTYRELSAGDRAFLRAMLAEKGPIAIGEVAARLGKSRSYATQYKRRLLAQGVIEERLDGTLAFALPGLRELVAQAASGDAARS